MGRKFPELTAYIDGASLGNPGPAGAGVSFRDHSDNEVEALSVYLGEMTNNMAEYRALILALEKAIHLGARRLSVLSDSELLVKQFNGQYRVKNTQLRQFFNRAKELQTEFEELNLAHIPRDENKRADQLAHQATSRRASQGEPSSSKTLKGALLEGVFSLNEVALLPVWSEVLPDQVNTGTSVAPDVNLGIPLLGILTASAESASLASVMALKGGLAVLRHGRSPQEQVELVTKVKRDRNPQKVKAEGVCAAACLDRQGRPRVGAFVHPGEDLEENVQKLAETGADLLILEASLGHGPELIESIPRVKQSCPQIPLLAGNITDAQGTQQVLQAGADGIIVGAPYILGLKVPLFTAIRECSQAMGESNKTLIADVGTAELMMASSRVARAVGAGACAAMARLEPSGEHWQAHILAEGLDDLADDVRMIMSCCGVRTVPELRHKAQFIRA